MALLCGEREKKEKRFMRFSIFSLVSSTASTTFTSYNVRSLATCFISPSPTRERETGQELNNQKQRKGEKWQNEHEIELWNASLSRFECGKSIFIISFLAFIPSLNALRLDFSPPPRIACRIINVIWYRVMRAGIVETKEARDSIGKLSSRKSNYDLRMNRRIVEFRENQLESSFKWA